MSGNFYYYLPGYQIRIDINISRLMLKNFKRKLLRISLLYIYLSYCQRMLAGYDNYLNYYLNSRRNGG